MELKTVAGFQCRAIQNRFKKLFNRQSPVGIWEKKESEYAKTLAKIQVTVIVLKQDIRNYFLPKFIETDLYVDAMLVPIRMGTNMAARNQQKHLSLSFTTIATVNLSLEELKNIQVTLF